MDLAQRIESLTEQQRHEVAAYLERRTELNSRKKLHAYVAGDGVDGEGLREALRERLPAYMMPDTISVLDALPRLPNGKVNGRALPLPNQEAKERVGSERRVPSDGVEKTLADIWSGLLQMEEVDVHDNFFEVGGDSILSIQMVSRAREAGVAIEPWHLADHPTIAGLASVVSPQELEAPAAEVDGETQGGDFAASGLSDDELNEFLDGLE